MSWQTNKMIVAMRSAGRQLGLNNLLAVALARKGYEESYDRAYSGALRTGDCVWDIGANVGYYTTLFADKVGTGGRVFAFEPSPINFAKLQRNCSSLTNVTAYRLALGRQDGTLPFEQGADDLGATSRIVSDGAENAVRVEVRSGAAIVSEGLATKPNCVKIDVEGFELEVLQGLGDLLDDPTLRTIGAEIHYRILNSRGLSDAPRQIETLLKKHRFRVSWPDMSHILAVR